LAHGSTHEEAQKIFRRYQRVLTSIISDPFHLPLPSNVQNGPLASSLQMSLSNKFIQSFVNKNLQEKKKEKTWQTKLHDKVILLDNPPKKEKKQKNKSESSHKATREKKLFKISPGKHL
jgi:hypothetical protein